MNVYSSVSKLIFAGLTTFALSSVAMAESEETNALSMSEEETTGLSGDNEEIQKGRSDQEGMAGKNSASHEELNKGMDHDDMSDGQSGMSNETDGMQDMEDDAPTSTTDQEGMVSKDTTSHEEEIDEGM